MTVALSGGGVLPDQPLPAGTRLRLSPTGDPAADVEVWVEDGQVHLAGHYWPLQVVSSGNRARVRAVPVGGGGRAHP